MRRPIGPRIIFRLFDVTSTLPVFSDLRQVPRCRTRKARVSLLTSVPARYCHEPFLFLFQSCSQPYNPRSNFTADALTPAGRKGDIGVGVGWGCPRATVPITIFAIIPSPEFCDPMCNRSPPAFIHYYLLSIELFLFISSLSNFYAWMVILHEDPTQIPTFHSSRKHRLHG